MPPLLRPQSHTRNSDLVGRMPIDMNRQTRFSSIVSEILAPTLHGLRSRFGSKVETKFFRGWLSGLLWKSDELPSGLLCSARQFDNVDESTRPKR
jgi:hypothetical protein